VVETLTELLTRERDGELRAKAAFGLGTVKAQSKPAVAALNEALKDPDHPLLRAAAADALGKIGAAASITYPTLEELSKAAEEDTKVRKAAAAALKNVKRPQPFDVPELRKALKDDNKHYRAAAVVALWTLQKAA